MRKTKIIRIDDQEITVKELTLRDIQELIDGSKTGILPALEILLAKSCGIKSDDIFKFAPSELEGLYAVFEEVNSAFFRIAEKLGLKQIMQNVILAMQTDFTASLANLSAPGTPRPGTTATHPQRRH